MSGCTFYAWPPYDAKCSIFINSCRCSSPTLGGVHCLTMTQEVSTASIDESNDTEHPGWRAAATKSFFMFPYSQQRKCRHPLIEFDLFPIISKTYFLLYFIA